MPPEQHERTPFIFDHASDGRSVNGYVRIGHRRPRSIPISELDAVLRNVARYEIIDGCARLCFIIAISPVVRSTFNANYLCVISPIIIVLYYLPTATFCLNTNPFILYVGRQEGPT